MALKDLQQKTINQKVKTKVESKDKWEAEVKERLKALQAKAEVEDPQPKAKAEEVEPAAAAKKNISVFEGPVSNTKKQKKYSWLGLAKLLLDDPLIVNSPEEKEQGGYCVRGLITVKRKDKFLKGCVLVIMDVDKPLDGHPLPTPLEIHEALKGIQHAVHGTATSGRSRIIVPVAEYEPSQTEQITTAFYIFCRSKGLNFAYAGESKTKSQPWFLPQTSDPENHQCFADTSGEIFDPDKITISERSPRTTDHSPETSDHNPTRDFIEALQSGTIHEAVKKFVGWRVRTSDLIMKQIFDEAETLIDLHCSDPEKVERWHSGEREKLEAWFAEQDFSSEGMEIPDGADVDVLMSKFIPTKEYIDGIGKEEWLYTNLVIKSHITVIIAMAGGGKTTFLFQELSPYVVREHGQKLYYVDADSPVTDHPRMNEAAADNGFTLVLPNANKGTGIERFIDMLKAMDKAKMPLKDTVIIFDTMKKFTDLMQKSAVKEFFSLCRGLQGLGATIIFAAHANKHRDKDNRMVPEGTGDVKNDTDTLIFFERGRTDEYGGVTITTVCDMGKGAKVRGVYEPFSFHITKEREVIMLDEPAEVINHGSKRSRYADDDTIVDTALEVISETEKELTLNELAEEVREIVTAGLARIKQCISRNSKEGGKPGSECLTYKKGKNNSHMFGDINEN